MLRGWTKSSYLTWIVGLISITIVTFVVNNLSLTTVLSLIGALSGFTSVVLIVNVKKEAGYIGLISALIYIVISFKLGNYSDSILNVLFIVCLYLPLILNVEYKEGMKPNTLHDSGRAVYMLIALFVAIYGLLFIMEVKLGAPRPYISVLAASLGIMASIMTSYLRLKESAYIWNIQNVLQLVLWSYTYYQTGSGIALVLSVTYLFYTINASTFFSSRKWGFK